MERFLKRKEEKKKSGALHLVFKTSANTCSLSPCYRPPLPGDANSWSVPTHPPRTGQPLPDPSTHPLATVVRKMMRRPKAEAWLQHPIRQDLGKPSPSPASPSVYSLFQKTLPVIPVSYIPGASTWHRLHTRVSPPRTALRDR